MLLSVSAVFMLLWFAALLAICFCCRGRFVVLVAVGVVLVFVGDVMGGSFSFCGIDALMVCCFVCQC